MRKPGAVMLLSAIVIAGCANATASPSPSGAEGLATKSPATPTAAPTHVATPTPQLTASPVPSHATGSVTVDATAVTVVDEIRVRSKPRISDDSYKFEPLLPEGTPLYILDGPISASGYTWYEVAPLGSRTLPHGWVAATSRAGEPWLAPGHFACPPVPAHFKSLAALPPAVGMACFPRTPITVVARLISCNCDVDGGWFTPEWFSSGTGSPEMLVEPQLTRPAPDSADWFWLNLDPAGQRPAALPVGEIVEVTGVFDHPAAAGCTFTELEGKPVPSQQCRLAFAVEKLVAQP
jgi:hypothetical protein